MGTTAAIVVALGLPTMTSIVFISITLLIRALCRSAAVDWEMDEVKVEFDCRRLQLRTSMKRNGHKASARKPRLGRKKK